MLSELSQFQKDKCPVLVLSHLWLLDFILIYKIICKSNIYDCI